MPAITVAATRGKHGQRDGQAGLRDNSAFFLGTGLFGPQAP
jgi:hypothetical protein